jgi:hypothetical protein
MEHILIVLFVTPPCQLNPVTGIGNLRAVLTLSAELINSGVSCEMDISPSPVILACHCAGTLPIPKPSPFWYPICLCSVSQFFLDSSFTYGAHMLLFSSSMSCTIIFAVEQIGVYLVPTSAIKLVELRTGHLLAVKSGENVAW